MFSVDDSSASFTLRFDLVSTTLYPFSNLSAVFRQSKLFMKNISSIMGWYTRSIIFIFDAFGRHHSKASALSSNPRISHTLVYNENIPFVDGAKRFYSSGYRRKLKHPILSALTMAGCVAVGGLEITKYLEKRRFPLETVPYTNRKHAILFPVSHEKAIAKEALKWSISKEQILAPHLPLCIRAQKIGHAIVEVVKSLNPHLNEFEWEFIVADDPASIYCVGFLGGKIVVPSGLLNRFKEDGEVAAFIAIAVGHVVGRHFAEYPTNSHIERHSLAFIRMELEADYIGLNLMAYAGYDPRIAPRLWENFGSEDGRGDFLFGSPSGETRAQLLLEPEVMDEALSLYRKMLVGRRIEAG